MSGRVGQVRRRDGNERAIIDALVNAGVSVVQISGAGAPDLLCWHESTWFFAFDVKGAKGTLTDAQKKSKIPFLTARTPDEALIIFHSHRR